MLKMQKIQTGNVVELTTTFFYALPKGTWCDEFESELSDRKAELDGLKTRIEIQDLAEIETEEETLALLNKQAKQLESIIDEFYVRNPLPNFAHLVLEMRYYDKDGNALPFYNTNYALEAFNTDLLECNHFIYRENFETGEELLSKINNAITPNLHAEYFAD